MATTLPERPLATALSLATLTPGLILLAATPATAAPTNGEGGQCQNLGYPNELAADTSDLSEHGGPLGVFDDPHSDMTIELIRINNAYADIPMADTANSDADGDRGDGDGPPPWNIPNPDDGEAGIELTPSLPLDAVILKNADTTVTHSFNPPATEKTEALTETSDPVERAWFCWGEIPGEEETPEQEGTGNETKPPEDETPEEEAADDGEPAAVVPVQHGDDDAVVPVEHGDDGADEYEGSVEADDGADSTEGDGEASVDDGNGDTLPVTGSGTIQLTLVALAFSILGGSFLLSARILRPETSADGG